MQPLARNDTSSPWYEAFSPPDLPVGVPDPEPAPEAAPSPAPADADLPAEALFDCYNA